MSRPEVRIHVPGPALLLLATLALLVAAASPSIATAAEPGSRSASLVDQKRSATLLFLPGPIRSPKPLLTEDLERLDGFSVGLFSPTLGRYSPTQMLLDISQGARVASTLYRPVLPRPPGLIVDPQTDEGVLKGWDKLQDRADSVPAELVPGLLGDSAARGGVHPIWIAARGAPTATALVAADQRGVIEQVRIVPEQALGSAIARAQKRNRLVIAALPPGGFGLGIIDGLAEAQPDRMFIVVQTPPDPARTRLLSIAARGVGEGGGIRSATTRRNGLVSATDVAPTLLERLDIDRPRLMQGQPIEAAPRMSAEQLQAMAARLELVAGRRLPFGRGVFILFGLILVGALGLARLAGRYRPVVQRVQRLVGLAMLWLPALLLVSAALRPSRAIETDIAVFGSLALALLTDRVVRWPRGPWLPVTVVLGLHAIDFVLLGSRYTGQSLLGSNPLYGARFFGVGNELEAVFTISALIATGAFLCDRPQLRPAPWFAGVGVAMAMFLGLGRLGADVGGVVMVAAGFGIATLYVQRLRLTIWRAAILLLLPVLGLAVVIAIDAVTGGESHLTRTIFGGGGSADLLTVIDRRFNASIEGARGNSLWVVLLLALIALIWGTLRRERLFGRLKEPGIDPELRRPLRAAIAGGVVATVVGALANDSGPAILIIGTIYLAIGVVYLRGRPTKQTDVDRR